MRSADLQVAVVAAEASGDVLAASVLHGLSEGCAPTGRLTAAGIGGPAMAATGFDAWWSIDELSVRGYVDANLPAFLGSRSNGAIAHFIIYGAEELRVAHDTNGAVVDMGYVV